MAKRTLTNRQKGLLIGGGVVVLAFLAYVTVVKSLMADYEHSKRALAAARQRWDQVQDWADSIRSERRDVDALADVLKDRGPFDLFSYTNQTLQTLDLKDNAELQNSRSYDPSVSLSEVEVQLRGVSLEQLVNFLHTIQSDNKLIAVRGVRELQPSPDGRGLVCSLTLTSPRAT